MKSYSAVVILFAAIIFLCADSCAQGEKYLPGSLKALVDLVDLPVVSADARDGMFSSTDPAGRGGDHGHYLRVDRDEYVLCEMEGSGVITRIWSANAHGKVQIYIDDKDKPFIECMFKDIFEDRCPPFQSPISGKSSGGWYSYWPIAYEKYCKIVVTQDPEITSAHEKGSEPIQISVPLKGARALKLIVTDAGDGRHADRANWAEAKLVKPDGSILYLGDLTDDTPGVKLVSSKQEAGKPRMNKNVLNHQMNMKGKEYKKGIGTNANCEILYELDGQFDKFEVLVGLDDVSQRGKQGTVVFKVEVDGKQAFDSGVVGFEKLDGTLFPRSLYYHVNYTTYPKGTKIKPFKRDLSADEKKDLVRVLDIWKNSGTCPTESRPDDILLSADITVKGGKTITLADIKGKGRIYSLKMKLKSADPRAYRRTIIKMYWDGEKEPSVWSPYGDFFGNAFGQVEFNSLPVGMGKDSLKGLSAKSKDAASASGVAEDECYSYWVMPFADGARIEIENGSTLPVEIACKISWRPADHLDVNVGRFCSQWRGEIGTKDKLVELLDVKGTGKFVGLIMGVQGIGDISYLEGNEQYYIDGEEEPSMVGTGTEDFFNGGWYYNTGVFDTPLHGLTEKEKTLRGRTSQYRLQVPDAVTFRTAFKLLIQHGTNNIHLDDDYGTTSYFYIIPPNNQNYSPPAAAEMNFSRKVLVRPNLPGKGAIGDEKAGVVMMRGGRFAEQVFDSAKASCKMDLRFWKDVSEGYQATNKALFLWWPTSYLISDEKHDRRLKEPYRGDVIICEGKRTGDYLEVPGAPADADGAFVGRYWLVGGPDYAQVRIIVNGESIGDVVDLYADEVQPVVVGPFVLPASPEKMRIEVVGKNKDSKGMKFGLYVDKTLPMLFDPDKWNIIGPFPFDQKDLEASFANILPPEKELKFDAKYEGLKGDVTWSKMPTAMVVNDDYQAVSFHKGIVPPNGVIAYAQSFVNSQDEMEVSLKIGHTRSIIVFLNGERVYEKNVTQRYKPDQETVHVKLKKGTNSLLVKTGNARGPWKLGLRFVNDEGGPVSGLEFMSRPGE